MVEEPPTQVSIRTDDKNAWRYDCIQRAADFYGVNRSDAVAFACEDVPAVAQAMEAILNREDLTVNQRKEIAERLNRVARGLEVNVEQKVDVYSEDGD